MSSISNIVRLKTPRARQSALGELIELDSVETACKILQHELAEMAWDASGAYKRGYFYQVAARAGLCQQCVSRIAYGETRWPRLRTCLVLFQALGFKVYLGR